MLSVCVTVKNRSRCRVGNTTLELFPKMVESLRVSAMASGLNTELVVCDWDSDDWPLSQWLAEVAGPVPVRIIQARGRFSRGRGRNIAAEAVASQRTLLFIDADMIVCPDVLQMSQTITETKQAFFPVCYSFRDPEHKSGWWRWTGTGNCAIPRASFSLSQWPEFEVWGCEDDRFMETVKLHTPVVRQEVVGFHHQWHPESQQWKDRYAIG